MADSKCRWQCPEDWSQWSEWLAAGLHARNRWRLPVLLVGILFAHGRRTVTTWLRAAGVSDDFQDYYYFLAALGRKTKSVATAVVAFWCFGPCRCPIGFWRSSTTRPPSGTVPRSKEPTSTATPRPARPTKSISTAISG